MHSENRLEGMKSVCIKRSRIDELRYLLIYINLMVSLSLESAEYWLCKADDVT